MGESELTIKVVSEGNDDTGDVSRAFGRPSKLTTSTAEVSAEEISVNLKRFMSSFDIVLRSQDDVFSKFEIDEIELNLSVSAEGGVSLVGMFKAGVSTTMKVKLKRRP